MELVNRSGTPGYIPPEVFKLQPYTIKGDVFSMGVILYMILLGSSPFKGKKYELLLDENKKANINYEKLTKVDLSAECKNILKRMLDPIPDTRISSIELLDSAWLNPNKSTNENYP